MDSLDTHPLGVNVGALVPFNTLRMYVMGLEESRTTIRASDEEISQMENLLRDSMRAGRLWLVGDEDPGQPPRRWAFHSQPGGLQRRIPGAGKGLERIRRRSHRLDPRPGGTAVAAR